MKNKTIKIKLLLAGSLLALCISIGIAVNDQFYTNLIGTQSVQEEECARVNEQTTEDRIVSSEPEAAKNDAIMEEISNEGGLTSSISTDSNTGAESEGFLVYLEEQQKDAPAASRGGSIRDEQKQDAAPQPSNQSAAALDDKVITTEAISESLQMPALMKEKNPELESNTGASVGDSDDAASGYKNEEKEDYPEDKELDLLARLITAEAQGEPYEAQVAVGAVVMNRVNSGIWPGSVEGVIYQNIGGYYQFTPVVNGWIDKPAKESGIKAAKAAMRGEDPTNGSQFYYDDTTTNEWILSKVVSVKIGRMIFAF